MQAIAITKTHQGRRPYQEDRFCDVQVSKTLRVTGVFDGHGGSQVADICRDNFPAVIRHCLEYQHDMGVAIKQAFQIVDVLAQTANVPFVGSTAVIAITTPTAVWIANAGDSMAAVVYKDNFAEMLSVEHKVENPVEKERIVQLGGAITYDDGCARVNGTLNVSRSLGDFHMKRYVIAEPYVRSISRNLQKVKYLVLASDGVWDVFDMRTLQNVIDGKNGDMEAAADAVLNIANSYGHDNATIIILVVAAAPNISQATT